MARKTDGERVEELQQKTAELDKANALLAQRVDAAERAVREAQDSQRETERQLADLRRAHKAETKLLKQQVEELKSEQLRWGARLWQVAVGLGVLVIGAALTTYLGVKK